MKVIRIIYKWCTATRLRAILSSILITLILLNTVRFIFLPPKPARAADVLLGFNEGYGTTNAVNDNNGTVAAGSITGAVWKTEEFCKVGKCLYFDGSGDKVAFADDADLDFVAADAFTITGWFRHPIIATNPDYLITKHESGTAGGYKIYMDSDGDLVFGVDDDGTWDTANLIGGTLSKNFDDNNWHFFAAQKDGTTGIYLYVDGVLIAQDTDLTGDTGSLANAASFYVGIDADGSSNAWSGFIDEVKIYRSLRTTAELKADYAGETPSRGTTASFGPSQDYLSNGLVGYWKMDESTWTIDCTAAAALDSSGNSNNARACVTGTGPAAGSPAKFGNGVLLDNSDDYLSAPDSSSLDITGAITIAVWVKPTTAQDSDWDTIVDKSYATAYFFGTGNGSGRDLSFWVANTAGINTAEVLTDGVWQHAVVTYNGQTATIYLNGTSVGSAAFSMAIQTNIRALGIGARYNGGNLFNGSLDELRIYNRALSATEVQNLYKWAPGPVGYWKMDENTGTNANDSSGNGNLGTLTNGTWTTGKFGSALGTVNADGAQDHIDIADNDTLDFSNSQDYTLSGWFKVGTIENTVGELVLKSGDTPARGYYLYTESNQFSCLYRYDTTNDIAQDPSASDSNWHYVSCVMDRAGIITGTPALHLFVDGTIKASDTSLQNNSGANSGGIIIGEHSASYEYNASIDSVAIYNYARTPGQIVEDMNAGHPAPGSPVGSAFGYWKFNEGYLTTAYDNSINANNLTLSAASWTNSGKFGKAFNGTGTVWATRADDADFDFAATEDASISLWFKSDSAANPASGADEYLLTKGTITNTGTVGYTIYADDSGKINFGIRSTNGTWGASSPGTPSPEDVVASTNDIYDGTWHNIIATKTGTSRIDLYVDGVLNSSDTSLTASGSLANAIALYLADDDGDSTNSLNGDIDEVQIFRSAISLDQAKSLYNRGSAVMGAYSTDSSNNASWSDIDSYCPPGQGSTCTAPVGEWKLDENTGTNAYDTSENDNTLAFTGSTAWAVGKVGSGLTFDGVDDGITIADPGDGSLDMGTGDFTLEAWVKLDSTYVDALPTIISKGATNSSTAGYWLFWNNSSNYLSFTISNGDGLTVRPRVDSTAGAIKDNSWHHIAAVAVRGGVSKLYIDGRLNATNDWSAYTGSIDTASNFFVGKGAGSGTDFKGLIDQVKIYKYARSESQIAWDYNLGGPIGWWKLDENTGTSANDSMGNSAAGTLTNTPTWATGKYGYGVTFAGSNQHIVIADDPDFDFADDQSMSIATWFKHDTASSQEVFLSKYNAAGYKLIMESDGDITCGLDYDSTWSPTDFVTSTAATYDDNSWHHIACVKDGAASLTLYIDGILIGTDSSLTANNVLTNADPLYLGIDADAASNDFIGSLDDVRIYRYPLSIQQIRMVMNYGALGFSN